jgi:hypothetical protein
MSQNVYVATNGSDINPGTLDQPSPVLFCPPPMPLIFRDSRSSAPMMALA